MYLPGPSSLQFADLGLSGAERAGYALAEGVMQEAEVAILAAASCPTATYDVVGFYADGSTYNGSANTVTVQYQGGGSPAFTLEANLHPFNSFRGQTMEIYQTGFFGIGSLAGVYLKDYKSDISFNAAGTMMVGDGEAYATGVNSLNGPLGKYDLFELQVIKDFYRDNVEIPKGSGIVKRDYVPVIYDWGLQSVSKLGYPVNKYWQQSKSLRDNGYEGYTHFVKDRLVGSTACRIELYTTGANNASTFQQEGTLKISPVIPSTPIAW
jgi:hypothetical protein